MAICREAVCAEWMKVADKLARSIMNLPQSLPTYALGNKGIYTPYFQQIKKPKSHCMIDWIELAIPHRWRSVTPMLYLEFISFEPPANPAG